MSFIKPALPETRRPLLKQMLARRAPIRALEFHDPLSAIIADRASAGEGASAKSFDLLWASGFARAASQGLPDIEAGWLERRLNGVADAMRVTTKPILVDTDTAPDPAVLALLCQTLESMGVSAVMVEDKIGAKRTSLADEVSHSLADPHVFAATIGTARESFQTGDTLIFARTEALIAGAGIEEALARAKIYLQSAADGIVIHSKDSSGDEIVEFLAGYCALQQRIGMEKPLIVIPTAYNHMADSLLLEGGASIVIHANHMIRAAYKAMAEVAAQILRDDCSLGADSRCTSVANLIEALEPSKIATNSRASSRAVA